jgi:hypothetical protein
MGIGFMGFGTLFGMVVFATRGWYGYSLCTVLIGSGALAVLVWNFFQMSRIITITDEHIESENYFGKRLALQWDHLAEIQQFRADRLGFLHIVRLITFDRRSEIYFTDRIERFSDLMTFIQVKAPHLRTGGRPTWWQRLWY